MKMIEIKDVCRAYCGRPVLNKVNITVEKGTIHGLIGENGSGKTTLIKCLTGIYNTSGGEILIDGEPVFENPKVKRKIGYVADSNQYFQMYSVDNMINLFKESYPTFSMERYNELNRIFDVPKNSLIRQLSKGQAMRVAFMLNMAIMPEVLVLDEPTSGLDAMAKKELLDLLVEEVEKRQMTVFITSHHLADLEKICDDITVIKHGKVIMQDDIDSIKGNVTKLQAVIENKPDDIGRLPGVIEYSNIGSIYTIVIQDYDDEKKKMLEEKGASFIEEIEVSLEEMFIYANIGGR